MFMTTIFVHLNKSFVVNWLQWHKKLQHLLEVPSIIHENVKNALFHWITLHVFKFAMAGA